MDHLSPEARKVVEETVGTLELRGNVVWVCYESVPWGLKWHPVADFGPLVMMMRGNK